jgi:hypothetical protein
MAAATGCDRKADVKARTSALEQAFPGVATNSAPAAGIAGQAPAAATSLVKAALAAARSDDYVNSVAALEQVVQVSGVTPDQLIAVQGARQAMVSELVNRAANGDAAAKAALAAIERMRSQ